MVRDGVTFLNKFKVRVKDKDKLSIVENLKKKILIKEMNKNVLDLYN